jgi:hypothetical protein
MHRVNGWMGAGPKHVAVPPGIGQVKLHLRYMFHAVDTLAALEPVLWHASVTGKRGEMKLSSNLHYE